MKQPDLIKLTTVQSKSKSNSAMSPPATNQLLGTVLVLLAIIVCSNQSVWAEWTDTEAITQCHQLHNGTVRNNSLYQNQYCFLACHVNNTNYFHNLNEGMRCPTADTDSYICKNGFCVYEPAPNGQIRLKIVSASLSTPINGYATVCLINTTETIHPPLRDRAGCVDCVTHMDASTANPTWNFECDSFQNRLFSAESSLVLEVWNHLGKKQNQYQGGAVLNLPEMNIKQTKQWDFDTKLEGGIVKGTIKTQLRWIVG